MPDQEVKHYDLYAKTNTVYVDFIKGFYQRLIAKTVITTTLKELADKLGVLIVKLDETIVAVRANSHTELLNEADDLRDMLHRSLIYMIHGYETCGDADKMAAAKRLFFAVKQFGLSTLRNTSHNNQTTLMDAMVEEIEATKHAADLALLTEVGQVLTKMKAAMASFKQIRDDKASEAGAKLDYTTRDVRREIMPIYRKVIGAVEAMAAANVDPEYGEFITELNGLIDIS